MNKANNANISELTFEKVRGVHDLLWNFVGDIAQKPKYSASSDWILTVRNGLRGVIARIMTVDREYQLLHVYLSTDFPIDHNPNEWVEVCDSHASVIFFGMDSAMECVTFTLNAFGWLLSPNDFRDIGDAKSLRQISPSDVMGGKVSGYRIHFPRTVSFWENNRGLLEAIVEYHDVSKHRSGIVTGGSSNTLYIRETPKLPGSAMSTLQLTVQSLAQDFQKFIDEALLIAMEECTAAFGHPVQRKK